VIKDNRALRPDAQAFDRIEIITVPRLKESGLSGSEWRISADIIFYRKGKEIHRENTRNVESACKFVATFYAVACDNGLAWFAGVDNLCDQEGCNESAKWRAEMRHEYCDQGHVHDKPWKSFRLFCERHKYRGDASFEDSDRNYIFSTIA